MNLRKTYLDAAEYIRKHGFSPALGEHGGPRCFIGTMESILDDDQLAVYRAIDSGPLFSVVLDYSETALSRCGWNERDAIAALEIAADLATPEAP